MRRHLFAFLQRQPAPLNVIVLQSVAQERVVAHFSELHAYVSQLRRVFTLGAFEQDADVLLSNSGVIAALLRGQLYSHHNFLLRGNLLYVIFQSSQHSRFQRLSYRHNLFRRRLMIYTRRVVGIQAELVDKRLPVWITFWRENVHQTKQLLDIILNRCPGQHEHPVVFHG